MSKAASVLLFKNDRLLRVSKDNQKWEEPGGKIEKGETPWQCAVRECLEETGIDCSGLPVIKTCVVEACGMTCFVLDGTLSANPVAGKEIKHAEWCDVKDALNGASFRLKQSLKAAHLQSAVAMEVEPVPSVHPSSASKLEPLTERILASAAREIVNTVPECPASLTKLVAEHFATKPGGKWIYLKTAYRVSHDEDGTLNGRAYADTKGSFSLQTCPKAIKQRLIGQDSYHHDLDFSNCVVKITKWMTSQVGMQTPHLDEYISNRPDVLATLDCYTTFSAKEEFEVWDNNEHSNEKETSVHDAKSLVLAVLHGGNYKGLVESIKGRAEEWMAAFSAEVKNYWKAYPKERFADQHARLNPEVDTENSRGKFLAACNFHSESEMLSVCENALKQQGAVIRVRCFDGLLVDKSAADPNVLAKAMEDAVAEAFPGSSMKVCDKSMELCKPGRKVAVFDEKQKKEKLVRDNLYKRFFAKAAWVKSVFTAHQKIERADTVLAHLTENQIVELYNEIKYRMELPGSKPTKYGPERIVCTHGAIVALCNATFGYIGRHKYCDTAKSWFVCGDDNIWSPTPGGSVTCLQLERAMQDDLRLVLSWLYARHANYDFEDPKMLTDILNTLINETRLRKDIQQTLAKETPFFEANMVDKLDDFDQTGHLLSFTDGYIDLRDIKPGVRPTLLPHDPNNFITMTVGYPFNYATDDEKEEARKELRAMFLEDEEGEQTFQFNIKGIASALSAGNLHELLMQWIGTGGNGKGVLDSACKGVYGDYAFDLQPSNLALADRTEKPQSCLLACEKKRFLMVPEAGKKKKVEFDESLINQLTGNDKVALRDLFKAQSKTSRRQHYTMFMHMNEPHSSSGSASNNALFRRLKVIDFPREFKDESQYDPHNSRHVPLDYSVKLRVTSTAFRHGFLRLLLDTYAAMYNVDEGHPDHDPFFVPDCVRHRTTDQQIASDPFAVVCQEIIVPGVGSALVLSEAASKICNLMQTEHRCFKSIAEIKKRLKTKYKVKRDTIEGWGKVDCIQEVMYKGTGTLEYQESLKRDISLLKEEGGGPASPVSKKSRLF
eukprot:gene19542-7177_t